MDVLVTGGAGFIGSHIADHLVDQGHKVAVLDNLETGQRSNLPDDIPLHEADLRDPEGVKEVLRTVEPTHVCHQAAQASVPKSVKEPVADAEVNVLGTLHLLEAARETEVERFVFASTGGALYGEVPEESGGAREEQPLRPISPYGAAKAAAEAYVRSYAAQYGLASIILRYANVYGPRQNPEGEAGVVSIFTKQILNGDRVTINARRETGDDGCLRDYVYVEDVANANLRALEGNLGALPDEEAVYNVGTGVARTTKDVAASVADAAGGPLDAEYASPRAGDLEVNFLDVSRFQKRGWIPDTAFGQGVEETVRWFQSEMSSSGSTDDSPGSGAKIDLVE